MLRTKKSILTAIFLGLIMAATTLVHAAEIKAVRCSGGVAKLAMDKFDVIERCGTPMAQEIISAEIERRVERLVYRFSIDKSEPLTIFTFEAGKLTLIEKNP
ncbi:DUF2845 domain-containing protein [Thalassotalea mangrovi]|uniref:DUF2845 domain-containing protein n=1 Tax=Thalassotalea mangrovi TaxID=2572245 RepID=A0A4U1B709_9GAMM|nr:DUF2845 domain-containing protein [Thalassotalea mangrovi]TKB45715.1 DUF2845 domain-containing protein [Thalassotalea mangrovi]